MNCADPISSYRAHLHAEERSAATVAKYLHDVTAFALWLHGAELTKERAADWKHELLRRRQAPAHSPKRSERTQLAKPSGFFSREA